MPDHDDYPALTAIFVTDNSLRVPPDGKYVSLSEALSWLAFGIPLGNRALISAMEHSDPVRVESARLGLIQAVERLTVAAGDGLIQMVGLFVPEYSSHTDRPARTPIARVAMLEFRRFDAFSDGLQRGRGLAWRPLAVLLDTAEIEPKGDEYRSIDVLRAGLIKHLKPSRVGAGIPRAVRSVAPSGIPDDEAIRAKAAEMRATGLNGREIASQMPNEPGFEGVKVTNVRVAITGQFPRGPRRPSAD